MNWSDDVVESVKHRLMEADRGDGADFEGMARAALSAITLQDIAKLPEVKALVEAALDVCSPAMVHHGDVFVWETANIDAEDLDRLGCALRPFTEASND